MAWTQPCQCCLVLPFFSGFPPRTPHPVSQRCPVHEENSQLIILNSLPEITSQLPSVKSKELHVWVEPRKKYTPMICIASPFVPEAATVTLFLPITSPPTPSLYQRSNNATNAIAFLPTTESCLALSPKAISLISKSLTTRSAPSIVAP